VQVDPERLPRSVALAAAVAAGVFTAEEATDFVGSGGDDYELLFTMPPAALAHMQPDIDRGEISVIGTLQSGSGLWLLEHGVPKAATAGGFDHFG
jgi:thiamine monophosphate kinase